MDVRDGFDALGLENAPQALADDEGAQVTDMQRLGNVGAAEVEQHGRSRHLHDAEIVVAGLGSGAVGQEGVG